METFLIEQSVRVFQNELIEKYQLDKSKHYSFNQEKGTFVEVNNG